MFKLNFLPARFGDSIIITYGDEKKTYRILIDGGTAATRTDIERYIQKLPESQKTFELVVVSHIDRDHIEGILSLLDKGKPSFTIKDFWYNGWSQLPGNNATEKFGAVQGERLTRRILDLHLPWNAAFAKKAVYTPQKGKLPSRELEGGMRLTILSPTKEGLADLRTKWDQEIRDANLDPSFKRERNDTLPTPGKRADEEFGTTEIPDVEKLAATEFEGESTAANCSSIAFLAEFNGKRTLLAADASCDVLLAALNKYSPDKSVSLDLCKISHHGSKYMTSNEFLKKLDCQKYIILSNGAIYYHPDKETVARIIYTKDNPELIFNYRSPFNEIWDDDLLKEQYHYSTLYPPVKTPGVEIVLA